MPKKPTPSAALSRMPTPWQLAHDGAEYVNDAWQRSVLYADVMRQRGNQYHEHLQEDVPHVLNFPYEPVMSGHDLARPVNYWLVRILPPDGNPINPARRPFVVVDPRAGHGPGIGGFKADSEVGAALRAGHPCYFIGFLPDPVAGQTVEDVMRAEAVFLEKVIELHPQSACKPVVVANCQGGWQILMTAAMRPELFGPIIVAGAPVSYWAGDNPMRYTGGLLGGSWLTALTSDLGAGRFDGAWLVQNFENLNPGNTWWGKQYHLYANVDTEAERYLDFEKYWGGYVFLNDVEIQYIVDNLFIGNRLSTAQLITSDGIRIDLRNIRSPIIVFCSKGDNITPPGQALGWVTDLYREQRDVLAHNQTIVYAVHESIGHLGIFVSGSVGSKEHREFTDNIDFVEILPPGIYEAVIDDKPDNLPNSELTGDTQYLMAFKERHISDVREIVKPDVESDRRFAAAARISDMNLGLYRTLVQPWVKAAVTPTLAHWMQQMHPLRLAYEWQSDRNPISVAAAGLVDAVRAQREPAADDNLFLVWQDAVSTAVQRHLDLFRDLRDQGYAMVFNAIYGSPWIQALAGLNATPERAPRRHPGSSPEHKAYVEREVAHLHQQMQQGDLVDAALRALFYVSRTERRLDERAFNLVRRLREQADPCACDCLADFKDRVRLQIELMLLDEDAALAGIPTLVAQADAVAIRDIERFLRTVLEAETASGSEAARRLERVIALFEGAASAREAEAQARQQAHAATQARLAAERQAEADRQQATAAALEAAEKARDQAEADARAAAALREQAEAAARTSAQHSATQPTARRPAPRKTTRR